MPDISECVSRVTDDEWRTSPVFPSRTPTADQTFTIAAFAAVPVMIEVPRILELAQSSQATTASLPMTVGHSMKLAMKLVFDGAILFLSLLDGSIALVGLTGDQRRMKGLFGRSKRGWCG
jgi:hypothetical protein